MTHLDLCSGIGGFHLAAELADFETIGFSEIEPYCCALLAEKWPEIRNYGDLRTADFSQLRGRITVLSAGVPCQPASLAGKRRGARDDRWLWPAVLDVVGAVQPAWLLLENPPGILTLDEFDGVLLRLGSLGYQIRMFSVPANAIGAKHLRYRVFIMAKAERERLDGRIDERGTAHGARASDESGRSGSNDQALADTDRARLEEHQSREPKQLATLVGTSGQAWERLARTTFGFTQPPLCGGTPRIPHRSHRLKSLGNAVVPQQAYPFFEAIMKTELRKAAE